MRAILFGAMVFAVVAFGGDDTSARARLVGSWQPADAGANASANASKDAGVWVVEHESGDILHVTYSVGGQTVSEFECGASGRECSMKDAGKKAKVSVWYNGAMLVALETRGAEVVKRRFAVAEPGDKLDVEVIPIQPEGKAETEHFQRAAVTAAKSR